VEYWSGTVGWFRNPKQPLGMYKTLKLPTNWCRISSINSIIGDGVVMGYFSSVERKCSPRFLPELSLLYAKDAYRTHIAVMFV